MSLLSIPQPLPDVSDWEYAGTAHVGSKHALVWSSNLRVGEKVESYKLMATEEGKPLKLIMMGMNLMTGGEKKVRMGCQMWCDK